jgi:hypothetical protein
VTDGAGVLVQQRAMYGLKGTGKTAAAEHEE